MDFVAPEVFDKLPKATEKGPYTVLTLPPESILYRADEEGKRDPSKDVPIFFTDKRTLTPYMRGKSEAETVSSYKTTKPIELFELTFPNLLAMLKDPEVHEVIKDFIATVYIGSLKLTDEQWAKLKSQGLNSKLEAPPETPVPFVIPAQRLPGPPDSPYPNYTNRQLAEFLCAMGFAGWIAMPGTVIQRNLNTSYYAGDMAKLSADVQAGTLQYNYNVYQPEIVLCDWTAVATRVSGGRRRAKTGRRARKGTRRGRRGHF